MMNLYRNFGCMLENWVADGYPEASYYSLEKHQDASSSDSVSNDSIRLAVTTQRSESEDSGVDLSNVGSPKASRSSVLTSEDSLTQKQDTLHETEEDLQPSPSSPAPSVCSSSSSCFSVAQGDQCLSTAAHGPSEDQTVRRNELEWSRITERESPFLEKSLDAVPRRRCNTTSALHTVRVPHRTGSLGPGRPHTQPADPDRQAQELDLNNRGPAEQATCNRDPELDRCSPGLQYLERVCRMLEQIARLQQQNQNLQGKMDTICSQRESFEVANSVNKRPEDMRLEDQSGLSAHGFRRRTVSDTWAFLKNRRKPKVSQNEYKSTEILLEEPDGFVEPERAEREEKASKGLKQKMSSLRKNEKLNHSRNGSLHGEKSVLRIFRNRRKTTRN